MLAWMPMLKEEKEEEEDVSPEEQAPPVAAGMLYRLTVAFPSWSGAILALYSIFHSSYKSPDSA